MLLLLLFAVEFLLADILSQASWNRRFQDKVQSKFNLLWLISPPQSLVKVFLDLRRKFFLSSLSPTLRDQSRLSWSPSPHWRPWRQLSLQECRPEMRDQVIFGMNPSKCGVVTEQFLASCFHEWKSFNKKIISNHSHLIKIQFVRCHPLQCLHCYCHSKHYHGQIVFQLLHWKYFNYLWVKGTGLFNLHFDESRL